MASAENREPALRPRPVILIHDSFWGGWPDVDQRACDCELTTDRRRLPEAQAVVFHLPTSREIERVTKYPGQVWVAWSMESEVTCPRLADPEFMRHFEITMTYRRDSTVWCPYIGPDTGTALLCPPRAKTEPAPAVYLQSSRYNASRRVQYVAELMKRLKVDSYGAVLHNRAWPAIDRGRESKLELIARYKFTLAFENSIATDYVSEKFYDPLIAGSVPVYLGAPNVADLAPAERCFVDAADFDGPAELAAYLNHLAGDELAYAEYLAWKKSGPSARFLGLLEELTLDPFCRLCAHLRRRVARDESDRILRAHPYRPLRRSWLHSLRRMISRFSAATDHGGTPRSSIAPCLAASRIGRSR
jgi:hypothetical protein